MRAAGIAALAFVFLLSCGYRGPIAPPSPELPQRIANLTALERGDQILINFDTPARTTDNLPIKRFSNIDLRIGVSPMPFDFDHWAASARQYEVPLPPANDPDNPRPHSISKTVPAADWIGKRVAILVRTSIKKNGHFSQWSNRAVVQVVPPIAPPQVQSKAVKQGFVLTWQAEGAGFHYEIFRQGPADKTPVQIGTTDASPYLDSTSQYDTPYTYSVVAQKDSAESLPSAPVHAESPDIFPPEVPTGMAALAGPDSIEVSWSRSPDTDLKGYYIYRSADGGPSERQNGLLTLPTYSDRNVQHGHTYRYAVSAVDQKGNTSHKSTPAEAAF